jgi:hypothetical protein
MKDKKTVSNDFYELKAVAKKMKVSPAIVLWAKEMVGNKRTNIEFLIEQWLSEGKIVICFNVKKLKP